MNLDPVIILLGFTAVLFACGGSLLVGRMLDPNFRVRQMRRFLRRNWLVMYFVSKDGKTIQPKVINADEDAFTYHGSIYVVEKGKIFRKVETQAGEKVQQLKEGGFSFNPKEGDKPVRYEEGTPVIFVDNEHIKPLSFNNEESRITPSATGSALNAWVTNQLNKLLAGEQKQAKYILWGVIIIGILCLANVGLSYKGMEAANEARNLCAGTVVNATQKIVNNTLIISQAKAGEEAVKYVSRMPGML